MPHGANDVVVVTEPLEGSAVDAWAQVIAEAMALRPGRMGIDLRHGSLPDAAAIAVLGQRNRVAVHAEGRLVPRAPTDRVHHTRRLAGLIKVFEIEQPHGVEAGPACCN